MTQNFILNAAGSIGQARALVIQQVQETKITTANYEEVQELLAICSKLSSIKFTLESQANRYGEAQTNGTAARTAIGKFRL